MEMKAKILDISKEEKDELELKKQLLDYATLKCFDVITFGKYPQKEEKIPEAIKWIVIGKNEDEIILLSEKILDCKIYHNENNESRGTIWQDSDIRKWLNNDFYDLAFSNNERKLIKPKRCMANDQKSENDYVFLLNVEEASELNATVLIAQATAYAKEKKDDGCKLYVGNNRGYCCWWLRDRGIYRTEIIPLITCNGSILEYGDNLFCNLNGVRPVIRLKRKI